MSVTLTRPSSDLRSYTRLLPGTPVLTAGWNLPGYSSDPENVAVFPMTPDGFASACAYLADHVDRMIDGSIAYFGHDSDRCEFGGPISVTASHQAWWLGASENVCECPCVDCLAGRTGEAPNAFAVHTLEMLNRGFDHPDFRDRVPLRDITSDMPEWSDSVSVDDGWPESVWIMHSFVSEVFGRDPHVVTDWDYQDVVDAVLEG